MFYMNVAEAEGFCLVLKALMADGWVGAGGLHVINQLLECLPSVGSQLLVVTNTLQLVLLLLWARRQS